MEVHVHCTSISCFVLRNSIFISHIYSLPSNHGISCQPLEAQLLELRDYMVHKDITMERIKELEEKLAEERVAYETRIKKLQDKVDMERDK